VPRTRWSIRQAEVRHYREIVRELIAGGARLELGPLRSQEPVAFSFSDCYAYNVQYGSVFVLGVSLLSLAPSIILSGFSLTSPDFDLAVDFLEDPRQTRSESEFYYLPDRTPFHRSQVLNHRIGEDGILRRGHELEGFLLARAFEPIPQRYQPASCFPAVLSVGDQFGDVIESALEFRVQPPYKSARPSFTRKSLFDCLRPSADPNEGPEPTRVDDPLVSAANLAGESDISRRGELEQQK